MSDEQMTAHQRAIDSWISGAKLVGTVWQGSCNAWMWHRGPDWFVREMVKWEVAG